MTQACRWMGEHGSEPLGIQSQHEPISSKPEADRVSAVLADGLLRRVALEAMHTGHLTLGIVDGGCGIPSMLSDRARFIELYVVVV